MVTKTKKKTKRFKFELIGMASDPFNGDPLEKEYGVVYSVKKANEFLDKYEGRVEWKGKTAGYNWGDIEHVRTRNGKPVIRD